jgi:hypothetical protein
MCPPPYVSFWKEYCVEKHKRLFCLLSFQAKGIALKTHKVLLPCSACLLHKEQTKERGHWRQKKRGMSPSAFPSPAARSASRSSSVSVRRTLWIASLRPDGRPSASGLLFDLRVAFGAAVAESASYLADLLERGFLSGPFPCFPRHISGLIQHACKN